MYSPITVNIKGYTQGQLTVQAVRNKHVNGAPDKITLVKESASKYDGLDCRSADLSAINPSSPDYKGMYDFHIEISGATVSGGDKGVTKTLTTKGITFNLTTTAPSGSSTTAPQSAKLTGAIFIQCGGNLENASNDNGGLGKTTTLYMDKTGEPISSSGEFTIENAPVGSHTLQGVAASHDCPGNAAYAIPVTVPSDPVYIKINMDVLDSNGKPTVTQSSTKPTATPVDSSCSAKDKDADGNCPSEKDALDCGSGVLNWITCSVINLAQEASEQLDSFISSQLDIDASGIFDGTDTPGSSAGGYYTAWNSFRVLATAVLVIAGLVMIVSQALGLEMLDAYTIRKTLPRLLVAIIGISLSWPLMEFVVRFFDTLGHDVGNLIYAPFNHLSQNIGVQAGLATIFGLAAGILVLGFTSLTFILTGLLAMFVAFITLVIRQIAIIMLVILAPIAIACYVLPGTEKVWKLWRENFMGLLMMFPIVVAFIAAGHVFAAVSLHAGAGDTPASTVTQLIGVLGYFVPYFLLPMAFRMATGAVGNIAGIVNDRHKGVFDRLKNARSNAAQKNIANMKTGTRFNNGALNALTARASTRNLGFGARGREAYDNKMQMAAAEFAKGKHGMTTQFKDNVLQAKTYASAAEAERRMGDDFGIYKRDANGNITNKAAADKAISNAIVGAKASGGFGASQQVWATKQLAATGTGYGNDAEMLATIARVSGNNGVLGDSMWGEMRGLSERAGRNDLRASYGTGTAMLENIRNANRSSGQAVSGRQLETNEAFSGQLADFGLEAARSTDNMQVMRNKPKSIGNMMKRLEQSRARYEQIAADPGTGPDADLRRNQAQTALGQIKAKMDNMDQFTSYGSEINAEVFQGKHETAPGSTPGNIQLTGKREVGYRSANGPATDAMEGIGRPRSDDSYKDEHIVRGIDPRTVDQNNGPGPNPE